MVLHERERRRTRAIAQRFPDVLGILASANEMGVGLVDGLELVTRWASGALAEELRKVRNDVAWNHDLTRALLSFADRLHVAQLTRTMTLIAEGSRSSGDLRSLLEIAAADTRARAKIERTRRREGSGVDTSANPGDDPDESSGTDEASIAVDGGSGSDAPENMVGCRVCGEYYQAITESHLQTHDMSMASYKNKFGDDVSLYPGEE